ncbi:serine/threonine-protein kinase 33 [Aplysia californica]|uniref:Serine/threonine-protein kinase 33 n=1 Tax=Aplysia californica TaxID=6500 RepID=A0ABM0JBT8_APLCA|nr:serine/threonine-protein kinase 33 [Aplysia californica]
MSSGVVAPSALSADTSTAGFTSGGGGSGGTSQRAAAAAGPRKNSAERSIKHTRMEDEVVQTEYTFGEIIGEGSFGKVYKAQHQQSGETVAIKEIVKEKAGSSGLRQLEKEVSIFKKVDHKNIIKLKEVIESPKKMYLIMELCTGGDLARLLQQRTSLTEADTKTVMSSLAEAIKYLHQQGILHRDLKLENILLAEEPDENGTIQIKVTDFGLSTQQNNNSYENMQEQYCGTLSYMAPEMNSTYSYPVDVWAMGIIMYYLLTRYPKDNVLNESLSKEGPKFEEPQWKNISAQARDLLKEMLTINPAYRVASGEVLNHEWFTGKKREHGNVLELMRDFGREQKENNNPSSNSVDSDGGSASAINSVNSEASVPVVVTPDTSSSSKKEQRKGSGGKKGSAGDYNRMSPSSGLLKPNKTKGSSQLNTPSPRPMSKTPTPKGSNCENISKSSTAATKTTVGGNTTSTKLLSTSSNGASSSKSSPANSRIALNQKVKKK